MRRGQVKESEVAGVGMVWNDSKIDGDIRQMYRDSIRLIKESLEAPAHANKKSNSIAQGSHQPMAIQHGMGGPRSLDMSLYELFCGYDVMKKLTVYFKYKITVSRSVRLGMEAYSISVSQADVMVSHSYITDCWVFPSRSFCTCGDVSLCVHLHLIDIWLDCNFEVLESSVNDDEFLIQLYNQTSTF